MMLVWLGATAAERLGCREVLAGHERRNAGTPERRNAGTHQEKGAIYSILSRCTICNR